MACCLLVVLTELNSRRMTTCPLDAIIALPAPIHICCASCPPKNPKGQDAEDSASMMPAQSSAVNKRLVLLLSQAGLV